MRHDLYAAAFILVAVFFVAGMANLAKAECITYSTALDNLIEVAEKHDLHGDVYYLELDKGKFKSAYIIDQTGFPHYQVSYFDEKGCMYEYHGRRNFRIPRTDAMLEILTEAHIVYSRHKGVES